MAVDWISLPLDLLATIALKLETSDDFVCFSATCMWWNRASSLIKHERQPPVWLLLTENPKQNPNCVRKILNPTNNRCYQFNLPETFGRRCWGSSYGWIAMLESDLNVKLFNPLTKAQISFPSLETTLTSQVWYRFDEEEEVGIAELFNYVINKLFVIQVSQSDDDDNEYVVMALCRSHSYLCFAKHTDQSWTKVSINDFCKTQSIMRVGDQVFALNDRGALVYWDVKELVHTVQKVVKPTDYSPGKPEYFRDFTCALGRTYLTKSGSDLLVVLRDVHEVMNSEETDADLDNPYKTVGFQVYKVDPKDKALVKIKDLGDVALFLNSNFSISVSDPLDKGLRRNSIYYIDDEPFFEPTWGYGYDNGVYDIESGEIEQLYNGDDTRSLLCPPFLFIPHCQELHGYKYYKLCSL